MAVKASDVARMADFYRVVLGLPELRRNHDEGGLRSVWLDAAGAILMIERSEAGGPRPEAAAFESDPPGLFLFALRIAPREHRDWANRLADHEVEIVRRTPHTLYVRDPEGNRVGLSSYPEPGAP